MTMLNPPHPGEFITGIYLEPNGISGRELAAKLDVAASTLSRVLNGSSRITPEMAPPVQGDRSLPRKLAVDAGQPRSLDCAEEDQLEAR